MKTRIETIAEQFNLFTAGNIPETHKSYFNERLNDYRRNENGDINTFVAGMKGVESGKFYECQKDTNYLGEVYYYIEHVYNLYLPAGSDVLLMMQSDYNSKKFYFYPYYGHTSKFNNISHYKRRDAVKTLVEPNRIGVFTEKKVLAWFEYCRQYMEVLTDLYNKVNGENNKHMQYIENFCNEMQKCGATVQKSKENTSFWIRKEKLFYIKLELDKSTNYLLKNIEFEGSLEDVLKIVKCF